MKEKEELNLKLFKHIAYNICIFMSIFIVFGLLVFSMVRTNIYANVDKELYEGKRKILEFEELDVDFILNSRIIKSQIKGLFEEEGINVYSITKKIVNPNIIVVVRDEEGKIVNKDIGRLSEYVDELEFDIKNMDTIYEISIDGEYPYRGLNFIVEGNEYTPNRYVQLLINIDSEKSLVDAYFKIIAMAVLVGCFLSIFGSYILSKKTLKPLSDNLIKQMEFVQNVSHELRTPLTIIQAKQELLLQEPNSKIIDKSEDIVLTLNETKRLSKLVKDLLILSRADNNKVRLQKESVNIDDYIKEIIVPYSEIAEMEQKD